MGVVSGEEGRGADAHQPAATGEHPDPVWPLPPGASQDTQRVSACVFQNEVTSLRSEVGQLKQILLTHKDCPVTARQREAQGYPSE